MNNTGKYIGLNQRIPFEVLDDAIHNYFINGIVDKKYVLQRMLEFTSGVNRANKATKYVVQILNRQLKILDIFKLSLNDAPYSTLKIDNRKALCLCLICLTYPITYDLLISLAAGFKVQNQINKKFISEKIMSLYGSNRTVDIAIDALIPMVIELNAIKRDKISLYSLSKKHNISNKFIAELVIYSDIKLSGSKSILMNDINYRPWYIYFDLSDITKLTSFQLLTKKESSVGSGYLTL